MNSNRDQRAKAQFLTPPLLVVPAFTEKGGGGHLVRSAALVRALRLSGREACLYIPEYTGTPADPGLKKALALTNIEAENWFLQKDPRQEQARRHWDLIILDRFRTPAEELASWAALAPILGIDEGGADRNNFDFLLDLLPGPASFGGSVPAPNLFRPDLLPLPKTRRAAFFAPPEPGRPLRVLVSFGAADPMSLAIPAALALAGGAEKPGNVTVTVLITATEQVTPNVMSHEKIIVREQIPDLREHLAEYDLLITHFGLTAFEALHARLPVILISPTLCHVKLARSCGFPHAGLGLEGVGRLKEAVYGNPRKNTAGNPVENSLKNLSDRCLALAETYGLEVPQSCTLGDFLADFSPRAPHNCPACGATRAQTAVLARFPARSYRRCGSCGIVYMLRTSPPTIEYETDYFFGFYKKQYGKTYLEDFPNLIAMGKKRLKSITPLLPAGPAGTNGGGAGEPPLPLLDIGCAYGPFLAAAREEGFAPEGIDAAEDAVRYVREELGISARPGFFPGNGETWKDGQFAVVSLWYVIEHFEDLAPVLKEINRLLKRGGVLAFSTPSFSGISGRTSPALFLEKSPEDHYTVWSPRICGTLLSRYGFDLKKIVVTGHHPERFPLAGRFLKAKGWISRAAGLGDTFEAYAVKREDYHD